MPRWDGFGRSLVFAALAAAGLPVAVTFGAPLFGSAGAVRLYVIATAGAYVCGLAADRSRQLAALVFAVLTGGALALLPIGLEGTALGAAGIVAFARSGLLQHQRTLRALVIEAALAVLGLGAAAFLASGGLLASCLAVWSYFLVQSSYFLIGGRSPRRDGPPRDPFEQARERLQQLLEDERGFPR